MFCMTPGGQSGKFTKIKVKNFGMLQTHSTTGRLSSSGSELASLERVKKWMDEHLLGILEHKILK